MCIAILGSGFRIGTTFSLWSACGAYLDQDHIQLHYPHTWIDSHLTCTHSWIVFLEGKRKKNVKKSVKFEAIKPRDVYYTSDIIWHEIRTTYRLWRRWWYTSHVLSLGDETFVGPFGQVACKLYVKVIMILRIWKQFYAWILSNVLVSYMYWKQHL